MWSSTNAADQVLAVGFVRGMSISKPCIAAVHTYMRGQRRGETDANREVEPHRDMKELLHVEQHLNSTSFVSLVFVRACMHDLGGLAY